MKVTFGSHRLDLLPMNWMLAALLLACAGCQREKQAPIAQGTNIKSPKYSEEDLKKLLPVGTESNKVIEAFGLPSQRRELSTNAFQLSYRFQTKLDEVGTHVAGFSVLIKEGKVEKMMPIIQVTTVN